MDIEHDLLHEYNEIKAKHPNIDHDMMMKFAREMPAQFEMAIMEYKHGCHIASERMYNEAVKYFENPNGTEGAYWDISTVRIKSGIDFNTMKDYTLWDYDTFKQVFASMGLNTDGKKYTCYDVNFVATFKYLIHNKTLSEIGAKPATYIKMALDELSINSEYGYNHYEELKEYLS